MLSWRCEARIHFSRGGLLAISEFCLRHGPLFAVDRQLTTVSCAGLLYLKELSGR